MPEDLIEILKKPIEQGNGCFIASNATAIGRVKLGDQVSLWFGAVLRGDTDRIEVGDRSNIQDNAVLHADPGDPCLLGHDCVVGHGAVVHGAVLQDHVLVGMNAVVLNRATVGRGSIIGANALVPQGMDIPPFSLVLGTPAKVVKTLGPESVDRIHRNAQEYVERAQSYLQFYQEIQNEG